MTAASNTHGKSTDATTIASQNSAVSLLMEQVSQIKLENKQMLEHFNWLATQMKAFMNTQTTPTNQCQARGHHSESDHQT